MRPETEAAAGGGHDPDDPEGGRPRGPVTAVCARLAAAEWFQTAIIGVIVLNAIVLGLETYETVDREIGDGLRTLDHVFLATFGFELAVRIGAHGRTPWRFFSEPWNVFDATIVAVAFVPGLSGSSTLLRLARLLRVARLVRILPDVHVLLRGVARSLPSIGGLIVLTLLLLFLYGMLGWSMFGDEDAAALGERRRGHADALQRAHPGGLAGHLRGRPRADALGRALHAELHPARHVHRAQPGDRDRAHEHGGGARRPPAGARGPRLRPAADHRRPARPARGPGAQARARSDTVEVNSSYYAIRRRARRPGWAERTPDGFVFHVKASG